jgi:hypothetical protein
MLRPQTRLVPRRAAICSVALLAVATAACQRTTIASEDGTGSDEIRPADLQAILDRRAHAVQSRDEKAFLADLDPANQGLVSHEQMVFNNLKQFTFADVRFFSTRTLGENGGVTASVDELLKLTADDAPGDVGPAEGFTYHLQKRDGRWLVTAMEPASGSDRLPNTAADGVPWNISPLKVIQVGSVTLAADDTVPDLQTYAAAAQSQYQKLLALWGNRPHFPGQVLFFSHDEARLRQWYNYPRARIPEGQTFYRTGVRKDGQVLVGQFAGARITVNLNKISLTGDEPELVMRHELTHAVTARNESPSSGSATWVDEGFARFVENAERPDRRQNVAREVAAGVRAGKFTGKPPGEDSDTFYAGSVQEVSLRYALGSTVFQFVADRKGMAAAVDMYQELQGGPVVSDVGSPVFDRLCQKIVGIPASTFLSQWVAYVRGMH